MLPTVQKFLGRVFAHREQECPSAKGSVSREVKKTRKLAARYSPMPLRWTSFDVDGTCQYSSRKQFDVDGTCQYSSRKQFDVDGTCPYFSWTSLWPTFSRSFAVLYRSVDGLVPVRRRSCTGPFVGPILVGLLRSGASVGESAGLSRDTKSNPPRSLKNPAQINLETGAKVLRKRCQMDAQKSV
jgi:hypothetical protein